MIWCQGSEAESHRQRSPLSAGGHPEDSQRKNETSSIHSKKRMSAKQLSKELSEVTFLFHIFLQLNTTLFTILVFGNNGT